MKYLVWSLATLLVLVVASCALNALFPFQRVVYHELRVPPDPNPRPIKPPAPKLQIGDRVLTLWASSIADPRGEGNIVEFSDDGEFVKVERNPGRAEWYAVKFVRPLTGKRITEALAEEPPVITGVQ